MSLEKQFWKLRWNLALLLSIIFISPFIGYYIYKKPKIVIQEKNLNNFDCQFLECYKYKNYNIWYNNEDIITELQINISYNNFKEKIILMNFIDIFRKNNEYYYKHQFKNKKLILGLTKYLDDNIDWVEPAKNIPNNEKFKNKLIGMLNESENYLTTVFCENK